MGTNLLSRIFCRCSHQFSWPRKSAEGAYYQVCLRCGAQYAYDWENMQRAGRIETRPARHDPSQPARRMNVAMKVRYRQAGSDRWHDATTANMSQTGVLLLGEPMLRENTPIEVVFEMPEAIAGQPAAKIMCQGRVVRVVEPCGKEPVPGFAATLRDYRFLEVEETEEVLA